MEKQTIGLGEKSSWDKLFQLISWKAVYDNPDTYIYLFLSCRPGEEPVSITDLLDLGSVPVALLGPFPPSSASVLTYASGTSPPFSFSSSCQPVEVPSTWASIEPEPSPPSSQSSLPHHKHWSCPVLNCKHQPTVKYLPEWLCSKNITI